VAGKSRFKRSPEIFSNFRTFLLSFYKIYGRKIISGIFPAEIFRKSLLFSGNFQKKRRKFPNSQPYIIKIVVNYSSSVILFDCVTMRGLNWEI